MESLPVIPTPPAIRRREFRMHVMPQIVFALVVAVLVALGWFYVTSPGIVGEVAPLTSIISSPKTGIVYLSNITTLQQVKAGDAIAQVVTTDPQVLASTLAVIQAETRLLKMNLEPLGDQQRYILQYDRLRLDWLSQRVDLASSRVKLQLAESDLRRNESLSKGKIISDTVFEKAKAQRDKLYAEVEERSKLVAEMEKSFQEMQLDPSEQKLTPASPREILDAAISVQDEKLRLAEAELSPVVLRAPVDGTVSLISRHSGETVMAGQPIMNISAQTSDHVIGYVRQPLSTEVAVGMPVEIRIRSLDHPTAQGRVTHVGSQMELINPLLLPGPLASIPVSGLPVEISLPPGAKVIPGEIVDLAFHN